MIATRRGRKRGWTAGAYLAGLILGSSLLLGVPCANASPSPQAAAPQSDCATPRTKRAKRKKPAVGARKFQARKATKAKRVKQARQVKQAVPARQARLQPRPRPGPIVAARMDKNNPISQPEYPAAAIALGEEGRVVLWLEIRADGSVSQAVVTKSSLSPRLDQAAVSAAKRWRYVPATRGGAAVASGAQVFVDFKMPD
jgi:protein TonB